MHITDFVERSDIDSALKKSILREAENIQTGKVLDQINLQYKKTNEVFYVNLTKKHSNLTANNIKACTYLKMNLSSKEIAPLLNISVHSVEIKRYRLRKKMELTRKQGIVAYIMTI